jgi:Domain of unknown function (DUF222)
VTIPLWTPPELSVAGFTLFFMATDLRTALRMYEAGARAILDVDWSVEIDDELLDGVRRMDQVDRQAPARRCAALTEVKTRGLAEQHGCRTAAAFLRQLLNCSAAEAGSRLALADDLMPGRSMSSGELLPPKLPALAAAVAAGEVSAEHVRLIRHTMRRIPNTVDQPTRDAAERDLVEHARTLDPDQLRHACARLLMCLDPDGSLGSTDGERRRQRAFTIGRQDRHGMYPVQGLLDPETGALLRAALEPLAGPRHTAQERDTRTVSQRMHDAVRDAAKLMLASGELPSQAGMPATLIITAKLDDLERKTGHLTTAHGGMLPVRDVLRLAANAKLVPAVFDTDGAPLWLGRGNRLATLHQRHVLTIMDKGCVYPGCDVPATRCEVMHLHDWVNGGPTNIDNLALGCDYHHHRFGEWTLQRQNGRVSCTPPMWVDPAQRPRVNTVFHDPELPIPPPE